MRNLLAAFLLWVSPLLRVEARPCDQSEPGCVPLFPSTWELWVNLQKDSGVALVSGLARWVESASAPIQVDQWKRMRNLLAAFLLWDSPLMRVEARPCDQSEPGCVPLFPSTWELWVNLQKDSGVALVSGLARWVESASAPIQVDQWKRMRNLLAAFLLWVSPLLRVEARPCDQSEPGCVPLFPSTWELWVNLQKDSGVALVSGLARWVESASAPIQVDQWKRMRNLLAAFLLWDSPLMRVEARPCDQSEPGCVPLFPSTWELWVNLQKDFGVALVSGLAQWVELGSATVQQVDRWKGIQKWFDEGHELLLWKSPSMSVGAARGSCFTCESGPFTHMCSKQEEQNR